LEIEAPIKPIPDVEEIEKPTVSEKVEVEKVEEHGEWYFYNQLDEKEKLIYLEILEQANGFKQFINFSTVEVTGKFTEENVIHKVEKAVRSDHPEYFLLCSNLWIKIENENISFWLGGQTESSHDRETYLELQSIAYNFSQTIPENSTDYEKARCAYDYVMEKTTYSEDAIHRKDIRGPLLDGEAVCGGYSYTFKFLCDEIGVPCIVAFGDAYNGIDTGPHAWNAIQIDNEWYWVDVTWGDAYEEAGENPYEYFCLSNEELFETHILDTKASDFAGENPFHFEYPVCESTKY
jgi:hypothetical protein